MKEINVVSLFDGISGGQIALQRCKNIKVKKYYASEINQNSIRVTNENFPNTIQLGDVCKLNMNEIFLLI